MGMQIFLTMLCVFTPVPVPTSSLSNFYSKWFYSTPTISTLLNFQHFHPHLKKPTPYPKLIPQRFLLTRVTHCGLVMAPFFFKELEGPEVLAGDGLFAWGISGQFGPTKKQYVNKWEVFAIPIFTVDRICCRDLTTCWRMIIQKF